MQPDYKNWVPKGMLWGFAAATAAVALLGGIALAIGWRIVGGIALGLAAILLIATLWLLTLHCTFSYKGKRKLSKTIVEGVAEYVDLPEGGTGLDVGCGSGALTIACAKRNPKASMVGCDYWGAEYMSFSKQLCENNARVEGVTNTTFQKGDANKLPFADETFDAVTSNYVYHNITGKNKQALLLETLRVLKKGGTFAIHDLMSPLRYGDMEAFCQKLRDEGYAHVELIDTTRGKFMHRTESVLLDLAGSKILYGRK